MFCIFPAARPAPTLPSPTLESRPPPWQPGQAFPRALQAILPYPGQLPRPTGFSSTSLLACPLARSTKACPDPRDPTASTLAALLPLSPQPVSPPTRKSSPRRQRFVCFVHNCIPTLSTVPGTSSSVTICGINDVSAVPPPRCLATPPQTAGTAALPLLTTLRGHQEGSITPRLCSRPGCPQTQHNPAHPG